MKTVVSLLQKYLMRELAFLSPDLALINGRPRHPQIQGFVRRRNGTLKKSLICRMGYNKTSNGLGFCKMVQKHCLPQSNKT